MHSIENMNYITNNNIFVKDTNGDDSLLKHIESLRTRLGFAQFKLSNGWEKNTLGDVECFWKQKQKQSMRNIPIPRFTQQDIIDKRSYIQASGAKHAKARRYRLLNRSLSSPSPKRDMCHQHNKLHKKARRKSHPTTSQTQYISHDDEEEDDEDDDDISSNSSIISSCSIKEQQQQQQQQQQQNQTFYFHHYDKSLPTTNSKSPLSPNRNNGPTPIHSVSSFDASCVPSDLNGEPCIVKNSLDYLSYAIAMTEKNNEPIATIVNEEENNTSCSDWTRTSQLRLSLSIPNSQTTIEDSSNPSSPSMNVAAQAMLMFVNRESST